VYLQSDMLTLDGIFVSPETCQKVCGNRQAKQLVFDPLNTELLQHSPEPWADPLHRLRTAVLRHIAVLKR
jgi:hypothetical protein